MERKAGPKKVQRRWGAEVLRCHVHPAPRLLRSSAPWLSFFPGLCLGASFFLLLASCGRQENPSAASPPGSPPPSVAATKAPPPTPPAPSEDKLQVPVYSYEPKGRRDPFQPPPELSPKRPAKAKPGLAALEVTDLTLAGIVWEQTDYYALVEAPNGLGYIIRRGAIIGEDTKVVKITKDSVVFEVRGRLPREEAQMVTLSMKKEE